MDLNNVDFTWILNKPVDWKIDRVKNHFTLTKNSTDEPKGYPILSLTMRGIIERDMSSNEGQLPDTYNGYNLLEEDDIVFNPMDLISGWVDCSPIQGLISPSYKVIRPTSNKVNIKFYTYYFQTHYKEKIFFPFGEGVHYEYRWGLGTETLKNFPIVVPPLNEQQQIVSFLDTKTSLIDSLIEKTQRKIELLKEKRTSLINEVVTKGLNPNVEMKDSGVEWIGEIPSHWRSPFFGLISNLQQGLQIPFDKRFFEKEEGMYEYITTKSVHRPNDPRQYVLNPKKTVVCSENEILYGRTGNTGEVITNVKGVFHNNFFKIEYDKNLLTKEYLIYQLTNSRFKETILVLSGTTTIPDLNHGDFNSMRCLTPPLSEQQQIVEYLDEQTGLIDKTISIEEKRIELLKEYRQSLISEVVTGKRKVTN